MLAFVLGVAVVPHRICERDAAGYLGDGAPVDALAAQVAAWSAEDLQAEVFATGSRRFDGEWRFGTSMMAAMGFGQVALVREGAARRENVARMDRCLDALLAPSVRVFDTEAWTDDALDSLGAPTGSPRDRGHAAYLGYAGLALALHESLAPGSRFTPSLDAITSALERRLLAAPSGLVETYPGEIYPVDNAAGIAALALAADARGAPRSPAVARGLAAVRAAVDPRTGLLAQAVDAEGAPRDAARGSGTALAVYFLSYADPYLAADLWRAVRAGLMRNVLGFGVVLEYPEGTAGRGDIDSGPMLFGFGVAATGFSIGASRTQRDAAFTELYATAHLFGAPFDERGRRTHATGGPIGDAILFAMVTAPRQTWPGRPWGAT